MAYETYATACEEGCCLIGTDRTLPRRAGACSRPMFQVLGDTALMGAMTTNQRDYELADGQGLVFL